MMIKRDLFIDMQKDYVLFLLLWGIYFNIMSFLE